MLLLKIAIVTNCEFHSNTEKKIKNNHQQKHNTKNLFVDLGIFASTKFVHKGGYMDLQDAYMEKLASFNLKDRSLNITFWRILFCTDAVDLIVVSKIFERLNV